MRAAKSLKLGGVLLFALAIAASSFRCAEVYSGWTDDNPPPTGSDMKSGDLDTTWHCYNDPPTTEEQMLNHCTEAERIERPSNIPQ